MVATQQPDPGPVLGGLRFVPATERPRALAELRARRLLIASVAVPAAGGLRGAIEEAMETALALRGALPPSFEGEASREATLDDQLFRLRLLGAPGVALALSGLARRGATLGGEDALTLRAWLGAARGGPVIVMLEPADAELSVLVPMRLADLCEPTPAGAPPIEAEPADGPAPTTEDDPTTPCAIASPPPAESASADPPPEPSAPSAPSAPSIPRPRVRMRIATAGEARVHALELDKARGPKPTNVLEKLFVGRYLPLLGAMACGEVDAGTRSVAEGFRSTFENSYRDAFAALRVTGRRPNMVFDLPDIAGRVARLNGARSTTLLLVDSLRYDLGELLDDQLATRLAGRAVCVERLVLWAALPTTTPMQLALLARGAEGLRGGFTVEPESDAARGRGLGTPRRERIGRRDLLKLELVEARLRSAGPRFDERFEDLADEVATSVERLVGTLAHRTLLVVFGDHGFRLPVSADGVSTGAALQGGASPEEVLVPAQAWLVGGTH